MDSQTSLTDLIGFRASVQELSIFLVLHGLIPPLTQQNSCQADAYIVHLVFLTSSSWFLQMSQQ